MKVRIVLMTLFAMSFFGATAQIFDSSFDPMAEMNRLAPVPNSPEAQAFTKYGNTPVNLYNGNPTIQIPIYTHNGREMSLPISLTYDASGVKVEQLATQVGLGWNLNVGGRISRITNGMPDDYHTGLGGTHEVYETMWDDTVRGEILEYDDASTNPIFDTKDDLIAYMHFLRKIYKNEYDTQPDYFSFNALGVSDIFVIDVDSREAKALNNPRIDIVFDTPTGPDDPIGHWTVTLEDGTKLYFLEAEISWSRNLNDVDGFDFKGYTKKYNSSWLLTKVESPTKKDTYELTYTDLGFWPNPNEVGGYTGVVNRLIKGPSEGTNWISHSVPMGFTGNNEYKIQQKVLSQIDYNGQRMTKVTLGTRCDLEVNSAISKIRIFNHDTGSDANDLFKAFDLDYDYFKTSDSVDPCHSSTVKANIRLKLEGIDMKDENDSYVNSYYFQYKNPDEMPVTSSLSQDYYGYYNGVTNAVLYPKHPFDKITDGANRSPNFNKALHGTLTRIIYPTGGETQFEFEPNYDEVVDYYTTTWSPWQSVSNTLSTATTLDTNQCNALVHNGTNFIETTPKVESYVFDVTSEDSYKFIGARSGSSSTVLSGDFKSRGLVKLTSTTTTPLTWSQLYDEACQTTSQVEAFWDMPGDGEAINLTLEPGTYQLFVANVELGSTQSVAIETSSSTPVYILEEKAGFRIKSITDYHKENERTLKRSFTYAEPEVISQPIYYYIARDISYDINLPGSYESEVLHRFSKVSETDKPHMGYGSVTEAVLDSGDLTSNGYIVHNFNTAAYGNHQSGVFNYAIEGETTPNSYYSTYELGKPKGQQTYDTSDNLLVESKSEYYQKEHYSNVGISVRSGKDIRDGLFPIPTQNTTTNKWFLDYTPYALVATYAGPGGGGGMSWYAGGLNGVAIAFPPQCDVFTNGTDKDQLCNPAMARLVKHLTIATGNVGNITLSQSIQYDGSQSSSQTTYYDYNDSAVQEDTRSPFAPVYTAGSDNLPPLLGVVNYTLKRMTMQDSKGDYYRKDYYYPENFSGSEYQTLRDANIVGAQVQTNTYKNNAKLGSQKTNFSGKLPSSVDVGKGTSAMEERVVLDEYRDDNLVQSKQTDGTYTAYVWGYDHRYLVARVDNATFTEVESALSGTYANLQTLEGTALATEMENLRTGLPNALVTAYTYESDEGVSSITDPTKNEANYLYDDYHRLEYLKDKDQHIVREYDYNYRATSPPSQGGGGPPDPLTNTGMSIISDNQSSPGYVQYDGHVLNLAGGVQPYNYTWSYKVNSGGYNTLGTGETFTLTYEIDTTSGPCNGVNINDPGATPNTLTFRCVIVDSDSPTETITVTEIVNAVCYTDHQ